jgi:hypothetical protein
MSNANMKRLMLKGLSTKNVRKKCNKFIKAGKQHIQSDSGGEVNIL